MDYIDKSNKLLFSSLTHTQTAPDLIVQKQRTASLNFSNFHNFPIQTWKSQHHKRIDHHYRVVDEMRGEELEKYNYICDEFNSTFISTTHMNEHKRRVYRIFRNKNIYRASRLFTTTRYD